MAWMTSRVFTCSRCSAGIKTALRRKLACSGESVWLIAIASINQAAELLLTLPNGNRIFPIYLSHLRTRSGGYLNTRASLLDLLDELFQRYRQGVGRNVNGSAN